MMTEDQAKVFAILADVLLKFILGISAAVAFFIVLFYLLNAKSAAQAWPLSFLETFLTGTLYIVFKHYFPAVQATVKGSKGQSKAIQKEEKPRQLPKPPDEK